MKSRDLVVTACTLEQTCSELTWADTTHSNTGKPPATERNTQELYHANTYIFHRIRSGLARLEIEHSKARSPFAEGFHSSQGHD